MSWRYRAVYTSFATRSLNLVTPACLGFYRAIGLRELLPLSIIPIPRPRKSRNCEICEERKAAARIKGACSYTLKFVSVVVLFFFNRDIKTVLNASLFGHFAKAYS